MDWTIFWSVLAPTVVGLAGIAATFFAPARAQKAVEHRRDTRAFRRARRLVAAELEHGGDMLELAVALGKVPPATGLERDYPQTAWRSHQGELALALTDDVWDVVRVAYAEYDYAVATLRTRAPADDPGSARALPDIPEDHVQMFLQTVVRMTSAREMLVEAQPLLD